MNVLFVYTNITGFHDNCYAFGLASIVSMAKKQGHKVKVMIVDSAKKYEDVLGMIDLFKPRVVGFSSVSSQFSSVKTIAEMIKDEYTGLITVCGGVHPTINPNCVTETNALNGIFIGEAEYAFSEFLDKVEKGLPYKDSDNFAYNDNGKLVLNKLKPLLKNLDDLPYPDKDDYPFEDTIKTIGYAPFFFSRGCPYLCSYCSNHAIAKTYNIPCNTPRYRSPESSIREIEEALKKFKIKKVLVGDDIFGIDKKWREEFCQKYKERIKVPFFCLLRANIIDEEFIQLLKSAGCYRISIGLESGNDYVRNKIMNRHMTNDQIINAFKLAKKYGFETNAINIIGTPGETEEMIWDTIRLNRMVNPTSSGVNIFYPYKGTVLGDYCFKENLVNTELYNDFSKERTETVLNYPQEYKQKLNYYRNNWESLVYPFDIKRRAKKFLRKTGIINLAKALK